MVKAVLAGIELNNETGFEEKMEECINLCDACGIEVVLTITQTANSMEPSTGFRKGKMEELKAAIAEVEVDEVVFVNNLSASMVFNLESYLDIKVIDRTALILDIFSLRAHSKEAIIQTEMARLKYNLPKMLRNDGNDDRMRGGSVNNRGAGENRVEIISRRMERRISELRKELENLKTRRKEQSRQRNRSSKKKVALVGYTNAGKSTLMNTLLKNNDKEDKQVYAKDQLFATLDTSVRNITYQNHDFLLFDTVGFVSDLPHELIEAFTSTLEVAKEADLLVHVMDCSNPNLDLYRDITRSTLKKIGADGIEMIEVFNKCDLLEDQTSIDGLKISCVQNTGIEELLKTITDILYPKSTSETITIPYGKLGVLDKYRNRLTFELVEHNEAGALYTVLGSEEDLAALKGNVEE